MWARRDIFWAVGIALCRCADHPGGPAQRYFAEEEFLRVVLADLAELVLVLLFWSGEAGGQDVLVGDEPLGGAADIVPSGVEGFAVGLVGGREDGALHGPPPDRFSYVTPPLNSAVLPCPLSQ